MQVMNKFPIVFRFRDIIAGNGFVANVLLDGRALLVVEEDGDQWVYGVQPGSVAGGASDASTALNEFKIRYQSVLFDIASDAKTFEDFKKNVEEFCRAVDSIDEVEWTTALESVRRTNVSLDELPTVKAETLPSQVAVAEVNKAVPGMNQLYEVARAA